jgi:hypothetical protein
VSDHLKMNGSHPPAGGPMHRFPHHNSLYETAADLEIQR